MCYFTNEGLYGALNILQYEPEIRPDVLIQFTPDEKRVSAHRKFLVWIFEIHFKLKSTLWGPTCDSIDKLFDDFDMKILETGDYLVWYNMGAYTTVCATSFNNFDLPTTIFIQ